MLENHNMANDRQLSDKGGEALAEVTELVQRFERVHPALAEAIKLFGITNEQYERTLQNMYEPRIWTSTSTGGALIGRVERNK